MDSSAAPTYTLSRLVDPLSESQFLQLLAARQPAYQRATIAGRYRDLWNWEMLLRAMSSGSSLANHLLVTRNESHVPPMFYSKGGDLDVKALAGLMERGHSVLAKNLPMWSPEIRCLTMSIKARLRERIGATAVASTGTGGALRLHFDRCDVLALQLEGRKRWLIFDDPVPDPVSAGPNASRRTEGTPVLDVTLSPGDYLLVPAGYWHRCLNGGDRSMHLALLFYPPTAQNILSAVARNLAGDPRFRRPFLRDSSNPRTRDAIAATRAQVIERLQAMSDDELIGAFVDQDDQLIDY
ncbi:MAG TPA: cupin domain-containing protein [Vicinamibacterales bacterium]|nr:cupin domain-containing protein [Vicinamibacterales bacterium]